METRPDKGAIGVRYLAARLQCCPRTIYRTLRLHPEWLPPFRRMAGFGKQPDWYVWIPEELNRWLAVREAVRAEFRKPHIRWLTPQVVRAYLVRTEGTRTGPAAEVIRAEGGTGRFLAKFEAAEANSATLRQGEVRA